MKKTIEHITLVTYDLVLCCFLHMFADRNTYIPDLPKQPYRYGCRCCMRACTHLYATPESSSYKHSKLVSHMEWEMRFVHMQSIDETSQIADTK